jgi:hypothetical protein
MQKLTITVESEEVCDLELAVDEALRQIRQGFTSGSLNNDENQGSWEITEVDEEE